MIEYRKAPERCQHKGAIVIDWMTPVLSKPPIPGVMWIERCATCSEELHRVPFPPPKPTVLDRLVAWWRSRFA
jgi:hypothetical protein